MQINLLPTALIQFISLSMLLVSSVSQHAFAHTVIQPPEVTEGKASENFVMTTHGCGEAKIIGTNVVFPDGVDSTVIVDGSPHNGPLSDFLENWGNSISMYQDRSVFSEQGEKHDPNGNVVGFWSGGGRALDLKKARFPFSSSGVRFIPTSCAKAVKFSVAIVDVCKMTNISGMIENDSASFWTPAVGSKFDGAPGSHGYDTPANFTINRDLEGNPLPESCSGTGQLVLVRPSAAQLDRDMPIILNGAQVWPQP